MRSMLRATTLALLLSVLTSVAHAQGATKIAYVNVAALMEAAPGRVAAESLLNREGDGLKTRLQKMQDSVNTMLTKYQKDEPTLSATAKDTRQKAIQSLETDLQAQNLKAQQQWQARQAEVMAPIQDAVKKVLDDIRIEDGYAMILANDPGQSVIVTADKNLDITDRVVSRLRATKAGAVAAPAAAKPGAPVSPAGVTKPKPPTQ
ncbi:MAG: OmpH family outer membrane protein [bacterium]